MSGQVYARRIRVSGVVQGVGFRPYVWHLAQQLGLKGWVRNDTAGVEVHVEGIAAAVESFVTQLQAAPPRLSRIDALLVDNAVALSCAGFSIFDSAAHGNVNTSIGPDVGVCDDCLGELFNEQDRRWRHPFITCTHCGPRYTITRSLPYDRPQTSMAPFPMCPDCANEYTNPASRRFHAQTTCCPTCGPKLQLLDARGNAVDGDPIQHAWSLLTGGGIVAIKGLGGFHIACDARRVDVVAKLRERKQREAKPFAVMVLNEVSARHLVTCDATAAICLTSQARPIVLLPKRDGTELQGVAPGLDDLGVMLPVTPIHYLLFHEAMGRPSGADWLNGPCETVLVMTSANPSGEPIVRDDDEALTRLAGIVDAYLLHDRAVVARCDDSVLCVEQQDTVFIRRSRGYAPTALRVPQMQHKVLALGAHFKSSACLTGAGEAYLSPHIGDLDNAATCALLTETVDRMLRLLQIAPSAVVRDLHPDFFSTRLADRFASEWNVPLFEVQHHHAHVCAVCAEHGVAEPVLGLALDGIGLGADGQAWGGELLLVDRDNYQRWGHLRTLPLPGGDAAAREPWRMALAALITINAPEGLRQRFLSRDPNGVLTKLLTQGRNVPLTSSMGRVFDAAAGLLGMLDEQRYEAEAAMLLESHARRYVRRHGEPRLMGVAQCGDGNELDLLPVLRELIGEEDLGRGAARFHTELVHGLAAWVNAAVRSTRVRRIALAGGCMHNRLLRHGLQSQLSRLGIEVLIPQRVSPGDAGVALGQAWVAQFLMEK